MKLIILIVLVALTFSSFQSRAVAETGTYCPVAQEYLQGDALESRLNESKDSEILSDLQRR